MSEHFRAFSFVDRLLSDEVGRHVRGVYHVPAHLEAFPTTLVTEAIGQLAAWSAMAATGFEVRPVAGIAGRVEFSGGVRPGDCLVLEAHLGKADREAVSYDGFARVGETTVVRLLDTLGPMVPMADFDDPAAVRARYERLCGEGAELHVFDGVPEMAVVPGEGVPGEWAEGQFQVPESAPFFGDHFPRRPVFPGTLLMQQKLAFARRLVNGGSDEAGWEIATASDVKLRSFMPPGECLEVKAEVESRDEALVRAIVTTRKGKRLNSSARFEFVRTASLP